MNITVLDNREVLVDLSNNIGTQNENNASVINFSFPENLINANKKIAFITDDGVFWDLITDNSYKITNAITKYKNVSAYIWLVDIDNDIDFRSKTFDISFNKNEEPDDAVPTEEEINGFDTMIAELNEAMSKVIDVDTELDVNSGNAVENSVIARHIQALEEKVDYLYANYTVTVTFKHEDETVIATNQIAFGDSAPYPTNNLLIYSKKFSGWTLNGTNYTGNFGASEFYSGQDSLSDAIKALTAEKQDVVITSYYTDSQYPFYTVNATGGQILYNNIPIENGSLIERDERISLLADIPEGKYMNNWRDKNNTIISYRERCNYYLYANATFTAEFSDEPLEKVLPIIYYSNNYYDVNKTNQTYTTHVEMDIPEGYICSEYGHIYNRNSAMDKIDQLTLTLENVDDIDISKNSRFNNAEAWNNTSDYPLVEEDEFRKKYRAYMIIIDSNGETSTYYSDDMILTIEMD